MLGLVFSTLNKRVLKNYDLKAKALIFGFAIWLLSLAGDIPGDEPSTILLPINIGLGLVAGLVYGYLLGRFFPRLKRKVTAEIASSLVTC